jgi:hypothetical protein
MALENIAHWFPHYPKWRRRRRYAIYASFQEYNSAPTYPLHDVPSSQAAKNLGFLILPIYEDKEGDRLFCLFVQQ